MFTRMSNVEHAHNHCKTPARPLSTSFQTPAFAPGLQRRDMPLKQRAILKLQSTLGNRAVQRVVTAHQNVVHQQTLQRDTDGSLSDDQITRAVRYNTSRHYSAEIIKQIQRIIGVNDDGRMGEDTARAIAAWQVQQGLEVDGKLGTHTYARLLPAVQAPAAAPAATTAHPEATPTTPPEQGGMVNSMISGLGSTWDSISEGAGDLWDQITGGLGDQPAQPTPEEPAANEPPQPSELDQLMLKDRLSVEEIRRARELIDQVTDETTRGNLYEALQAKVEYHSQRDNQSTSGG